MSDCLSEFTYSMYVDGELAESERLRVQQHLAQCAHCQALAAALETENRVLAEVFSFVDEPGAARQRVGRSLLLTAGSALAVAVALDQVVAGIGRIAPGAVSWMNSFSLAWFQGFFFNNALDLIREGPAMLNALVTILGVLVLGGIAVGVLRHFLSRHPMSIALLAMLALMLGVPRPASAIESRHATNPRVGPTETVDQSLVLTGDHAEIDGTVNGNVLSAGQRLAVRGTVKGDLLFFGHELEISGTVEGSVYVFSGAVVISGHVGRNVLLWAGAMQIDPSAHIDGDVLGAGGDARLAGTVGRDVNLSCGTFETRGSIGRNLQVSTNLLTVDSSARIAGNLEAHVGKQQEVEIEPGAVIGGKTTTILKKKPVSHYTESKYYFWQAIWMAGALVVGLLLRWLVPGVFGAGMDSGGALLRSAGVGFLALVATPVAVIVACITLVGIPAGAITLVLWLVSLLVLAKVFAGAALGRALLPAQPGASPNFVLALLAGLAVVFVAINLPYVGGWLSFLIVLVGLGLEVLGARSSIRRGAVTP